MLRRGSYGINRVFSELLRLHPPETQSDPKNKNTQLAAPRSHGSGCSSVSPRALWVTLTGGRSLHQRGGRRGAGAACPPVRRQMRDPYTSRREQ